MEAAPSLLSLRHFTGALVLLALPRTAGDDRPTVAARSLAVENVLARRRGRVWRWPETDDEPIWMTYQALRGLAAAVT